MYPLLRQSVEAAEMQIRHRLPRRALLGCWNCVRYSGVSLIREEQPGFPKKRFAAELVSTEGIFVSRSSRDVGYVGICIAACTMSGSTCRGCRVRGAPVRHDLMRQLHLWSANSSSCGLGVVFWLTLCPRRFVCCSTSSFFASLTGPWPRSWRELTKTGTRASMVGMRSKDGEGGLRAATSENSRK